MYILSTDKGVISALRFKEIDEQSCHGAQKSNNFLASCI